MRSGAAPKPSAAADMYAFGVCALLACCSQGSYNFAPSGELQEWSREAAAEADVHLPALLDALLVPAASAKEALERRLSATQVLLHPFLDTTAEREAASRASEEAQERLHAAHSEEAAARRRLFDEQQLVQRQLQHEAAEKRKALAQAEEQMHDTISALHRDVQVGATSLASTERLLTRTAREMMPSHALHPSSSTPPLPPARRSTRPALEGMSAIWTPSGARCSNARARSSKPPTSSRRRNTTSQQNGRS